MIQVNGEDFKLDYVQNDIDDPNVIYFNFINSKGDVVLFEVRDGNFNQYEDSNKIHAFNRTIIEKSDLSPKSFKTLCYCYNFWLNSDNGLNCFIEPDVYEDDGFVNDDFVNLMNELYAINKEDNHIKEICFEEGDAINIYPRFFEIFNIKEISTELEKQRKNKREYEFGR